MFVFRIDGLGGQGVESATRVLSRAGFLAGFNTQDFFIAGPERRGSHVTGIVKMDKAAILSRQMEQPDFLIVMDMGLDVNEVLKSTKEGSIVIFNSRDKLHIAYLKKHKIKNYHVDANNIAMDTISRAIPNTVMLGALVKIFNKISLKNMKKGCEIELGDELNKKAVDEGYKGVKR